MSHMDEIEGREGMRGMAVMTKAYYDGLRAEGFNAKDALNLTGIWLNAIVTGSQKGTDGSG